MRPANSRFFSSLGLLLLLNLLVKPAWIFAIDRVVQNRAGLANYGSYFSLFNLSVIFSFLLDWGLTTFLNRQLATSISFFSQLWQLLQAKLVFTGTYLLILLLVAWLTGISNWALLASLALVQIITSFFLFFRAIITAGQQFQTDAWLSILDKTLMILVCGSILLLHRPLPVTTFALIQAACLAFALVVAILFSGRLRPVTVDPQASQLPIREALPYALIVLLMAAHYRADGFLLERLHPNGPAETGLYAAAYRLLDAANMIGFLVASFLLPYIAHRWQQKRAIENIVLTARHVLIMYGITIAVITWFLAPWIHQFLYNNGGARGEDILRWSLPALVGYMLVHLYGTVLTAIGQIRLFCKLMAVALCINLLLNLLLIPTLGAKGCCIAAIVSQVTAGIVTMIAVHQKTGIRYHFRSAGMYIFITLAVIAILYWGQYRIHAPILLLFVTVITLILMRVTKLVLPGQWIHYTKT